MRMRVDEQVIRRTTCMKTQERRLIQGGEGMLRKTRMRTLTNSRPQGEGTWRTTPMRIQTKSKPREAEVGEESLPLPCTTTRPRLTTRSASTPTTSYPILKWLTKAGGSG